MGLLDDRLRLFRIAGDPLGGDTPSGTDHEEVRGDEGLVSPSDGAVPLQQDNQVALPDSLLPLVGMVFGQALAYDHRGRNRACAKLADQLREQGLAGRATWVGE